jgi:hypothetical protein
MHRSLFLFISACGSYVIATSLMPSAKHGHNSHHDVKGDANVEI